ncbi:MULTISPECIES: EamA family transporter [unclassified Hyphomicrobium]|uniref:EamA family transporter n=1 Tax=unclassified Hyphomicrobium TaxID=2619925 RepID=UPI000213ED7D|nr:MULTISPECIES: EamA family transporter [unclassified Hyphomicrobium]CCB66047.1 Transporter [Hyphomicrobium sp. MC1]
MPISVLLLIITSVSLSALAQICFKFGLNSLSWMDQRSDIGAISKLAHALITPGVLAGLGCYGIGTLLWLSALGKVQLSQAYPFVGLGFVMTALAGHLIFGDTLSSSRIGGTILVFIGIFLIAQR